MLPVNGAGGFLEALSSHNSLKNEEHMDSVLSMAQLNTNFASNVMNSSFLENSSTSRSAVAHELYNPVNVFRSDDTFSQSCRGGQKGRKKQQLENTKGPKSPCKTKLQTRQDPLPFQIKKEPDMLTPIPKKRRLDVNQENVHQQQQDKIIEEMMLKELQDRNPQLVAMIEQHGLRNQLQLPILHSAPQLRGFQLQLPKQQIISLMQDQGNLQTSFAPLLDGGICSRRLKQYLYHLRNNTHDNSIAYWMKFVSEYYAPSSRKKWCFCKYENIELHTTGVFCPNSMETWFCDICGSRSGKGLEASFDIFPRLFKIKFESGMLDEILFLDSPRAYKISSGLVLEYSKAIQESVYEKFRVVHEGKLRIVFRYDLKILSWEFCAQNHEEFLLRRLITPQVNQMVQAAKTYQNDIQNGASFRVSSEDLQTLCDTFVSAGDQLARNMETPLIAEVVDSMKDIMTLSHETKTGPIECLDNYSQSNKTYNQTKEKQRIELFMGSHNLPAFSEQPGPKYHANAYQTTENVVISDSGNPGLAFVNLNHQLIGQQNSSIASTRREGQESCSMNSVPMSQCKNPHQALVDRLLHEMAAGKYAETTYRKRNLEAVPHQFNRKCLTRNDLSFSKAASSGNLTAAGRNVTVKDEPCSPERLPEAFQSSSVGFAAKMEDMGWCDLDSEKVTVSTDGDRGSYWAPT
ncbi:hypothetical protein DH2020_028708 [Rehmannia glutinosa]|uniref:Uncharacterized protein n=1 Tax=Rehmannia glutinosa TaxID=99300 RepID=A0ABR0VRH6_REHGL